MVKAEAAAIELARRVGLDVPASELVCVLGRDVLLVERFDRTSVPGQRPLMASVLTVLTLLGLNEMTGRQANYPELADELRTQTSASKGFD